MKTKRYISLLILCICSIGSFAQKTANNWFFGNRAGITFNQSPPVSITNGRLSTFEGSSSISDVNGRLLFYSNGITVFNREHEIMQNGSSLAGDLSSTCSNVIVLQPGSNSKYYIFNTSAAGSDEQFFTYSIVDMTAGNGLGAVIEKNTLVKQPIFEKIAAVRHCNKVDVWIVVKNWDSDEYYSYLFSSAGLSTVPVVSHTGFFIGGFQNNGIGALKFSADSKRMAAVHAGTINRIEIMDFDNSTGMLSNSINFAPNDVNPSAGYRGVYGCEFSPNGKILYVSSNNNSEQTLALYQFDVSLAGITAIRNSRQIIADRRDFYAGGLQLGPDQRIYLALWKDSALSVITYPDVFGPACNFLYNDLVLRRTGQAAGGYASESGLPGFIASDLVTKYAAYSFAVTRSDCKSKDILCNISNTEELDSVKWDFGDGQASTALSPSHTYALFGNYLVTLRIYRKVCSTNVSQVITSSQNIQVQEAGGAFLPADTSVCGLSKIVVRPGLQGESYMWSNGEKADSLLITAPGTYWLDLLSSGCVARDSIIVKLKPSAIVHLGNDTTVCMETPIVIKAPTGGTHYEWSDGSTGTLLTVTTPGNFYLKFETINNCYYSDTLDIAYGNCEIYFPTAFTPNGDGINDQFGLIHHTSAKQFELSVYNRFGQVIYQSNDQFQKWDGTSNGKKQSEGTYIWMMRYRPLSGLQQMVKGTVLLIR